MPDISVSQPAAAATPTRGLSSTLVLALGTFAVGTDAFIVAGFLPSMADSLRVSPAAAGLSVTVFAIAYAVLAPILATATARLPRRALLVTALLVLAVADLGSALAPSLPVLIACRMGAAAGAAVYTPGAGAVGASLVRPRLQARAFSVVIGGLTVGTALGVPLGDLASEWLGWRAAMVMVAGLSMLSAVGVYSIMPRLPGGPRERLRTRMALLARPGVIAVLPLTVLGMTASYTVYAYSVPALGGVGIAEASIALMLFLYGLGAVLGNVVSGYATDRWGPLRVLVGAYLSMALSLALLAWLAFAPAIPGFVVGALVLVWGTSTWMQSPPQQIRLISAAPEQAAIVVSLNASAIYVGIGSGTALGALALPGGAGGIFGLAAAVAVLTLVYLAVTARYGPDTRPR